MNEKIKKVHNLASKLLLILCIIGCAWCFVIFVYNVARYGSISVYESNSTLYILNNLLVSVYFAGLLLVGKAIGESTANKPVSAPAPAPAPASVAQATPSADSWTCACGTTGTGNFCNACGAPKEKAVAVTDEAPAASDEAPVATVALGEAGDIDLTPYTVGTQNVEYIPEKHGNFHRADGLMGAIPQAFINKNMPKCPLCCGPVPYWSISQANLKSWRGNLALFKCSQCEGVISISIPDIMTATNQFTPGAANVTLTNMAAKKKAGKEAKTAYVTFEHVGNSGVSPDILGKELRLPDVQAIAERA